MFSYLVSFTIKLMLSDRWRVMIGKYHFTKFADATLSTTSLKKKMKNQKLIKSKMEENDFQFKKLIEKKLKRKEMVLEKNDAAEADEKI